MKKILLAISLLLSLSAFGQLNTSAVQCPSLANGNTCTLYNISGAGTFSYEYKFTGSPSGVSIVLKGVMTSGTLVTLDTYTGTSDSIRHVDISTNGPFPKYTIAVTLSGGTSPRVTVNGYGTIARNGSGSGSGSVTHTGDLNAGNCVVGNGVADIIVIAGCSIDANGLMTLAGGITITGPGVDMWVAQTDPTISTVAGLPGSPTTGQVALVTDCSITTVGGTCAGSGSNKMVEIYDLTAHPGVWSITGPALGATFLSSTTAGRFKWYDGTALRTFMNTVDVVTAAQLGVGARRICDIPVGDSSGSAITNAQLGPQKRLCFIPFASTLLEIDVDADGGTPNVIVGYRNPGASLVNVLSGALATGAAGVNACSNTGGTTGIDATTTCTNTLQNTALAAGGFLELVSGTAGGTAKLMTIHAVYTEN